MRSEDEGACTTCLLILQTTDHLSRACLINKALVAPSPARLFLVLSMAMMQS